MTRTLFAASSFANASVKPTTPYFAAVWGVCSGKPLMAPAELTLTRLPPPWSSKWGIAAAQVFQTARPNVELLGQITLFWPNNSTLGVKS